MYRWQELPLDVLQQLTQFFDEKSVASARLVCRSWRAGISRGVTRLRLVCLEHGCLGWDELGCLQQAFPQCRELDVRDFPITEEHAKYLTCFSHLTKVHVSHLHRTSVPYSLMVQLACLSQALQVQNAKVSLHVELRPKWASDQVLQQAAHLPATCQVTLLHLPSICHDVTLEGLRCALSFSQLVSLKMHLYGPCITDGVFAALRNLSNLRELCFGVLAHVSDTGFRDGLLPLTQLRELNLVNVSRLTDQGIFSLVASWSHLERLSLSKCGMLTNTSLHALAGLPSLRRLVLSDNQHFTEEAVSLLPAALHLTARECPGLEFE
eukprot:jgi/Botrbrau1/20263/Bobra.31_1s0048.1